MSLHVIKVANAVAHSTFNSADKIVACSSSFVNPQNQPATKATISTDAALSAVKSQLGATPTGKDVGLEYFSTDSGDLVLTHAGETTVDGNGHLVKAFVDASTGKHVGLVDYTTLLASPDESMENVVDPEDKTSSPSGWTTVKGTDNKRPPATILSLTKGNLRNTTTSSKFSAVQWIASSDSKTATLAPTHSSLQTVSETSLTSDALGADNADMTTSGTGADYCATGKRLAARVFVLVSKLIGVDERAWE
ncbi:hypothetical protein BKA62DRAFT_776175 [Auriculariales sp. MPI-PUGE-AT-0066]|nr:hypothetical protein BKA62DRAFT_776175 [Auriculariales sp. MPI-PUGE-AT-0066]